MKSQKGLACRDDVCSELLLLQGLPLTFIQLGYKEVIPRLLYEAGGYINSYRTHIDNFKIINYKYEKFRAMAEQCIGELGEVEQKLVALVEEVFS